MTKTTSDRWIVGLTGKNASGKGEAAKFVSRLGYQYYSLSDILRDEAKARATKPSREVLIDLGQELRRDGGPGVLAYRTIEKLDKGRYVIDSIRHPDEIVALRDAGTFLLLAIDAPIETRYQRAQARGRTENASSLDEFRAMEDRERTTEKNAQQLDESFKLADVIISNDKTVKEFREKLSRLLEKAGFPT